MTDSINIIKRGLIPLLSPEIKDKIIIEKRKTMDDLYLMANADNLFVSPDSTMSRIAGLLSINTQNTYYSDKFIKIKDNEFIKVKDDNLPGWHYLKIDNKFIANLL